MNTCDTSDGNCDNGIDNDLNYDNNDGDGKVW